MLKLPENLHHDRAILLKWYLQNKRILPWRSHKDPYKIWISEVMLQQTTVTAVIPYYEKFIQRFPTVNDLANSQIEDIYEYWAGLGYYSRARNLHKAALIIQKEYKNIFPQTADELIQLPGFGPYTSRAVSSLAFNEQIGVLDGNVIRILTRRFGLKINWWETRYKQYLQNISDALANSKDSADINQAMMELGATICTPKKVMCLMCPWQKKCVSLDKNLVTQTPKSKPKAEFEIWQWDFFLETQNNQIKLYENSTTPFLKKNWLPLSTAKKLTAKPKKFNFKHGVTKYDIYVNIHISKKMKSALVGQFYELDKISQINPTSLMKKILADTRP